MGVPKPLGSEGQTSGFEVFWGSTALALSTLSGGPGAAPGEPGPAGPSMGKSWLAKLADANISLFCLARGHGHLPFGVQLSIASAGGEGVG